MKKSRAARAFSAFGIEPEGIAFARIARPDGAPPILESCEYVQVSGPEEWAGTVRAMTKRHQSGKSACSLIVDERDYSLLLMEAPAVAEDELRAAIRWKIRDLVDFHIDDAVIDAFDVPARKGVGRAAMMYVVAARIPALRERTAIADEARLDVAVIDIPELAQRNVAALLPEDVAGVAVLRVGATGGLITLTRQTSLYLTRRIDTGLDAIQGAAAGDPHLSDWLDTLVIEVQRSLDYYESNFDERPITDLVIAPVEVEIPGLCEHLTAQLGIACRIAALPDIVDCAETIEPAVQARCFPAVGAALRLEAVTL